MKKKKKKKNIGHLLGDITPFVCLLRLELLCVLTQAPSVQQQARDMSLWKGLVHDGHPPRIGKRLSKIVIKVLTFSFGHV
jgi:hypothetical protein